MINDETKYWDFMRKYAADLLSGETKESIKDYYRQGNDMLQNELAGNETLQEAIEYAGDLESFAEDMWQEYHRGQENLR